MPFLHDKYINISKLIFFNTKMLIFNFFFQIDAIMYHKRGGLLC